VKHWKFPEIPFSCDSSRKQRRAGCFLGRKGEAAENGPEQNSSSREAGKRTAKTEKTGRRILTNEDEHDRIKK
jgi:hypothetical protein